MNWEKERNERRELFFYWLLTAFIEFEIKRWNLFQLKELANKKCKVYESWAIKDLIESSISVGILGHHKGSTYWETTITLENAIKKIELYEPSDFAIVRERAWSLEAIRKENKNKANDLMDFLGEKK